MPSSRSKKRLTLLLALLALGTGFLLVNLYDSSATVLAAGPTQSPGTGSGALATDASGNLGIGSVPSSSVKLLIQAPNALSTNYALSVIKQNGTPILQAGNDGTVTIPGLIGGAGVNATNVSAGQFGANTGNGNYSFPAGLGIGTTNIVGELTVSGGTDRMLNVRGDPASFGLPAGLLGPILQGVNSAQTVTEPITLFGGTNLMGGNIGIGTTAPRSKLEITTAATTLASIQTATANSGINITSAYGTGVNYAPGIVWSTTDNTGSAIPLAGLWSRITPIGSYISLGTSNNYSVGITNTALTIDNSGNVGIGTATPGAKLDVTGPIQFSGSNVSAVIPNSGILSYESGLVATRLIAIGPNGSTAGQLNLTVANSAGGQQSNMVISPTGNVGIGTTAPQRKFHIGGVGAGDGEYISAAAPSLILGNNDIFASSNMFGLLALSTAAGNYGLAAGDVMLAGYGSARGNVYINSNYNGAGVTNVLVEPTSGNVGIGTTAPAQKLDVNGSMNLNGALYTTGSLSTYGAVTIRGSKNGWSGINFQETNGTNDKTLMITSSYSGIFSAADNSWDWLATPSTFTIANGGGKLTAGTVDPPYTINGEKFATYVPGMTGQKEETAATIRLSQSNQCPNSNIQCAVIDFNSVEKGSDLWLFRKVIGANFDKITVLLTPSFDGSVWYEKDVARNRVTIFGSPKPQAPNSNSFEVSYRLSAPRFDSASWQNSRTDDAKGLIVND